MHTHAQQYPVHPHMKDISKRLQSEVDTILGSVDDKTIYAEFRDLEMVEIENGEELNLFKESLDERIHSNMKRRSKRHSVSHHKPHSHHTHIHNVSQSKTTKLHQKINKFVTLLFTPFEL